MKEGCREREENGDRVYFCGCACVRVVVCERESVWVGGEGGRGR
jgi:hypothetical protein